MRTTYWKVDPRADENDPSVREAGALLAAGAVVAFPTETVYGLGANALSDEAVEAVFRAKGRPADNPLIVHIAERAQLDALAADVPAVARRLIESFWPGPLTLVLPARPGAVSPRSTAGLPTIAVRMPDHPVARGLIRAAGCPIAAPSANISGRPSPTTAAHVRDDLDGKIAGVLDAGPAGVGLESTVAEIVGGRIHILRPGGVTAEQLRWVGAEVAGDAAGLAPGGRPEGPDAASAPRSPGVKYAHYAPRGELTVVAGPAQTVEAWIRERVGQAKRAGERTGVIAVRERAETYRDVADVVVPCGRAGDSASAARELYAALRRFDAEGATRIWAEAYPSEGLGEAVMNRLLKAAGHRFVRL